MKRGSILLGICILTLVALLSAPKALADRLDLIQKRGTLIVGVKSDYPPFGMLDANGRLIGFEADLAADLAHRLGFDLQLVAVSSTNRLQKLEEGAIDVVIATLGDTSQRRQIATLIEPNYYASGATVIASPQARLSSWADLRGQKVCATQGAYFNRAMAERFLLDLQIFNGTRDARLALRDGRCIAWLYDDTGIIGILGESQRAEEQTPLPSMMISPWAMAIAASERGLRLERAISEVIADWHRSGWLIATERRWGIEPSQFLADLHQLWSQTRPDGTPVCTRLPDGNWPAECRNKLLLTSTEVGGLHRVGLLLKEQTGLNLSILYDGYDRHLFLSGIGMTLKLMVGAIVGSLLLGCLGALVAESGIPGLNGLVRLTTAVGRMTPPLLLIYLVFFGIGHIAVTRFGWSFDGSTITIFCLSVYTGCAIVFALLEACTILKNREPSFVLRGRTLPRAMRLASAAVIGALVNVVKATGMASAIAVPELISVSTAIIAEQGNAAVMMNVLLIVYFLLVMAVVQLFSYFERRLSPHELP
ncbi:MAG: transporter substrate-binding domain-containing protein [Phycisphaerales bacterium]|nr:transporter substrate-binding domain-containing protein [Phycisphaerales bacterium]